MAAKIDVTEDQANLWSGDSTRAFNLLEREIIGDISYEEYGLNTVLSGYDNQIKQNDIDQQKVADKPESVAAESEKEALQEARKEIFSRKKSATPAK